MSLSRRQFFERLREVAEGPHRWRERRVAQLCEYALQQAPAEWTPQQREEASRAVEHRLAYLSDASLRAPEMPQYVEAILRSKDLFLEPTQVEQEYYDQEDSHHEDCPG